MDLLKYQQINNSFKKSLVYHFGNSNGFFSEYNNMILAMIYCFNNKIKFTIYSKDAIFAFKDGLSDYFEIYVPENNNLIHKLIHRRTNYPYFFADKPFLKKCFQFSYNIITSSIKLLSNTSFWTNDIFDNSRDRKFENERISLDGLNIEGNIRELSSIFIATFWKYKKNIKEKIDELINSLPLPDEYISFHIRSGDKFIESDLVESQNYIQLSLEKSIIKNAFILTDDYKTIVSLRNNYPDWTFYSLTKPEEKGYFHKEFIKMDKDFIKSEAIKLFAAIEIMSKSKLFIGTFSSNIGMFMGMKMPEDKTLGVDLPKWQIW